MRPSGLVTYLDRIARHHENALRRHWASCRPADPAHQLPGVPYYPCRTCTRLIAAYDRAAEAAAKARASP